MGGKWKVERGKRLLLRAKSAIGVFAFLFPLFITSCEQAQEHTAPPIYDRDSVSMMTSYGVNTLISDSGVI